MSGTRSTMIHRTSIQRDTNEDTDPRGNPGIPTWTDVADNVPCRVWYNRGRSVEDGKKTVRIKIREVLFPLNTDVTERDQLTDVTDRRGKTLFSGPVQIEAVGHRRDHLAAWVEDDS